MNLFEHILRNTTTKRTKVMMFVIEIIHANDDKLFYYYGKLNFFYEDFCLLYVLEKLSEF